MGNSLIEIVERLLDNARPGGQAHQRLLKYRDQVERNVMLGPSTMKYIRGLVSRLDATIECRHLSETGRCSKRGRIACDSLDDYTACRLYEENRPQTRGNLLGG